MLSQKNTQNRNRASENMGPHGTSKFSGQSLFSPFNGHLEGNTSISQQGRHVPGAKITAEVKDPPRVQFLFRFF